MPFFQSRDIFVFGSKLDLTVENPLLAVKLRNNCYNCNVAKQTLCYDISIVEKKMGTLEQTLIFLDCNHGIMWFYEY